MKNKLFWIGALAGFVLCIALEFVMLIVLALVGILANMNV